MNRICDLTEEDLSGCSVSLSRGVVVDHEILLGDVLGCLNFTPVFTLRGMFLFVMLHWYNIVKHCVWVASSDLLDRVQNMLSATGRLLIVEIHIVAHSPCTVNTDGRELVFRVWCLQVMMLVVRVQQQVILVCVGWHLVACLTEWVWVGPSFLMSRVGEWVPSSLLPFWRCRWRIPLFQRCVVNWFYRCGEVLLVAVLLSPRMIHLLTQKVPLMLFLLLLLEWLHAFGALTHFCKDPLRFYKR